MINKQADSFHGELWFFTQRSGKLSALGSPAIRSVDRSLLLAHKVTELKKGSEEVNVSYADPDNQSCMDLFLPQLVVRCAPNILR